MYPRARTLASRSKFAARSRRFNTNSSRLQESSQHQTPSAAVTEETQDVTAIDALLKAIKHGVNPQLRSIMPMRIPSMWAEARLEQEQDAQREAQHHPETNDTPNNTDIHNPTPRHMHDSYTELVLPFGTDRNLLEEYTNASGGIRTGKLMEHLDSLAGSISYKHVLGPKTGQKGLKFEEMGMYIVTAGVERLDMLGPINPNRDLCLSGQVIYTGRSSMEVVVRMETMAKEEGEQDETILLGRFSMVCRDAHTHRARVVNPLIISTDEEKHLFAIGEELKKRRASLQQRSLSKVPPSSKEAAALHEYYLKYGEIAGQPVTGYHPVGAQLKGVTPDLDGLSNLTRKLVPMGSTRIEKCMLMFPQERNVHQKIFGGYLMRLAYELGFSNASMFCRGRVRFLALDEISFKLPVPIGSILRLTSVVLYDDITKVREHEREASYQLVHIGVRANVVDIKTGTEKTTNEFRFTWRSEEELPRSGHGDEEPMKMRKVVPNTYREAMLWLEGKRAVNVGDEIRELQRADVERA